MPEKTARRSTVRRQRRTDHQARRRREVERRWSVAVSTLQRVTVAADYARIAAKRHPERTAHLDDLARRLLEEAHRVLEGGSR